MSRSALRQRGDAPRSTRGSHEIALATRANPTRRREGGVGTPTSAPGARGRALAVVVCPGRVSPRGHSAGFHTPQPGATARPRCARMRRRPDVRERGPFSTEPIAGPNSAPPPVEWVDLPREPERGHSVMRYVPCVISAVILFGCASTRSWTYRPEPPRFREPILEKTVVVPPVEDHRTNHNFNGWALYLIPLMPFGWQTFDTPEGPDRHLTSTTWHFQPSEDISKAIAQDLQNLGLFKEAFFGYRPSEGDLALRAALHSTRYDAKLITYGLSLYGPLLWLIGLPAGTYSNELRLELRLEDPKTGELYWSGGVNELDGDPVWLYYLKADFHYDSLLKRGLKRAFVDLEARLVERIDRGTPAPLSHSSESPAAPEGAPARQ